MLMIRLARVGATKQPHYRVVVIEKDRARNGRSVEVVGTYNPRTEPATVTFKRDRIDYWTGNGAQLSDRVAKLLKNAPVESTEETPVAKPVSAVSKGIQPPAAKKEAAPAVETASAAEASEAPVTDAPGPEASTETAGSGTAEESAK